MSRSCWLRMPWRDREKLQILAPKLQRRAIVPPKLERVVASALMFTFSFCFAYVFTCVIFFSLQFQNTLEFALKKSVIHRARLEAGFHELNKLKTLHSNSNKKLKMPIWYFYVQVRTVCERFHMAWHDIALMKFIDLEPVDKPSHSNLLMFTSDCRGNWNNDEK